MSPRLTVSLTAVEHIRVIALAERLGIPAAAVLRQAVAAYVAKFLPQPDGERDNQQRSTTTSNGLQGDLLCAGGPAGTYCRDCNHFADEIAVQTGNNTIEKTRFGCMIWAQSMGHAAPSPRRDIRLCPSCKHFQKAPDASPQCFIIDRAGASERIDGMPEDLQGWLLQKQRRDRS